MTTEQIVFLDTSIQIQRTLSDPAQFNPIEEAISKSITQSVSSPYVWMEYQRTVVADFAYVHQLMLHYDDWGSLFRHVLDGNRSFRPRSAVRCTQIIGDMYTRSGQSLETARYIVADQIVYSLQQRFWRNVHAVSDMIICDLVTKGVTRQQDQRYAVASSCRKDQAACHLPAFLADHQSQLQTLLDYLTGRPHSVKEQPRLERLLSAVIRDPRAVLGQASCWPLGDVIIALQVPTGATLWTLDKEFAPLAQALDIPLYRLG